MTEAIPISKAPVSVITPRKPPIYKKNLKTEFEMSIIILHGVIKKYSE